MHAWETGDRISGEPDDSMLTYVVCFSEKWIVLMNLELQPFIDEVIPKEECESGTDFSEDNSIEQISEFLA